LLADELRSVTEAAPVKDWELETYIIADLYLKKKVFFDIYPNSNKGVTLSLSMIQAIALNNYLAVHSRHYNALLRIYIEPFLIL
jgi:hypothetical protein